MIASRSSRSWRVSAEAGSLEVCRFTRSRSGARSDLEAAAATEVTGSHSGRKRLRLAACQIPILRHRLESLAGHPDRAFACGAAEIQGTGFREREFGAVDFD